MAFWEIGRGKNALVTFTTIMNMPPPMTRANFNSINVKLLDVYQNAASLSKSNVALDVREKISPRDSDAPIDYGISIDST